MKKTISVMGVVLFVMAIMLPTTVSAADTININYVTMFVRMHNISKVLQGDFQDIEKQSNGRLKFNYRGGPEAIKVFDQAMAIRSGAVDMAMTSPHFYGKMVKGMEMLDLSKTPVYRQRETGLYDFMNSKFNKVGIQFLIMAPKEQGTMYHMYTKKPINSPAAFKGMSIAGTSIFDAIAPALGMTAVNMLFTEQYSGMERGVVDVARGGLDSVMAMKLYEVADYIIKPGFGSAPACLFMNLEKFNSLPKDLQVLLVDSLYSLAQQSEKKHMAMDDAAFQACQKKGMRVIEFKGAERDYYLKTIEDAMYQYAAKDDPETAQKVYELTHK